MPVTQQASALAGGNRVLVWTPGTVTIHLCGWFFPWLQIVSSFTWAAQQYSAEDSGRILCTSLAVPLCSSLFFGNSWHLHPTWGIFWALAVAPPRAMSGKSLKAVTRGSCCTHLTLSHSHRDDCLLSNVQWPKNHCCRDFCLFRLLF